MLLGQSKTAEFRFVCIWPDFIGLNLSHRDCLHIVYYALGLVNFELWCFSFSCRYMNGAATNPDAHVVAYAAAQVKKGLEIAKKLGAENFGMITLNSAVDNWSFTVWLHWIVGFVAGIIFVYDLSQSCLFNEESTGKT